MPFAVIRHWYRRDGASMCPASASAARLVLLLRLFVGCDDAPAAIPQCRQPTGSGDHPQQFHARLLPALTFQRPKPSRLHQQPVARTFGYAQLMRGFVVSAPSSPCCTSMAKPRLSSSGSLSENQRARVTRGSGSAVPTRSEPDACFVVEAFQGLNCIPVATARP